MQEGDRARGVCGVKECKNPATTARGFYLKLFRDDVDITPAGIVDPSGYVGAGFCYEHNTCVKCGTSSGWKPRLCQKCDPRAQDK